MAEKKERWLLANGQTLTFTGEFGDSYQGHPSSAPWEPGSDIPAVRLGPREQWDEYPLRGKQWPEPEADYEALGYPETRVYLDDLDTVAQWERTCQALIMPRAVEFVVSGAGADWSVRVRIKNNQDDIE